MSDERTQLAEHVFNLGAALWSMALHGGKPRAGELVYERMNRPRPGDLVVEVSSFRKSFDPDAVGHLIRKEGDPDSSDDWVIEPLLRPGEELRWSNAQFVAIPDTFALNRWSGLYAEQQADLAARAGEADRSSSSV